MTPQAKASASTDDKASREEVGQPPPEVEYEEALVLGVWPMIGLAPMDDTDHTVEGVA